MNILKTVKCCSLTCSYFLDNFRAGTGTPCQSHDFCRGLPRTPGQAAVQEVRPKGQLPASDLRNRAEGGTAFAGVILMWHDEAYTHVCCHVIIISQICSQ